MSLIFRPVALQQVRDPLLRAALQGLQELLRPLYRVINNTIETDPKLGRTRIKAAPVLPDVPDVPSLRSTYGVRGEVLRSGDRFFRKTGSTGTDKNWQEITAGPSTPSFLEVVSALPVAIEADLGRQVLLKPGSGETKIFTCHRTQSGTFIYKSGLVGGFS